MVIDTLRIALATARRRIPRSLRDTKHGDAVAGDARCGVAAAEAAKVGVLPEIADGGLPARQPNLGEAHGDVGGAPVPVEERDRTDVIAGQRLRPDLEPGLRSSD